MIILDASVKFRFSTINQFRHCPYQYLIDPLFDTLKSQAPNDPLIIGSALHKGIELGYDAAESLYVSSFHEFTNKHENELIKLEYWIQKVRDLLPNGRHEVFMENDFYHGTIDFIDDDRNMYDFKYSNNIESYLKSDQLHIYKHFYEEITGEKINDLFFVFIPKTFIRQRKDETLGQFRSRLRETLESQEIKLVKIDYDPSRIADFYKTIDEIKNCTNYEKRISSFCNWCQFLDYCQKGDATLLLPKSERRTLSKVTKKSLWIYGEPFSGKTTFANGFPNPLMLNTDGNIKFVDAPYIAIKDEVEMVGRLKKTTLAWQKFKDAIEELETQDNDFKTIIIDLVEDLYMYCRLYMYDKLGITHESDDSFKAWDKVRTEFLSTMKRCMNLDYENIILISHLDATKNLTKKTGESFSKVSPAIQPKIADKLAGMVDIVGRVYVDQGIRKLSFKTDEIIFGGGRLELPKTEIGLSYKELEDLYKGEK